MRPVMPLNEMIGWWENEPGNEVNIYVNMDYIMLLTPMGDNFLMFISGMDIPFVVKGDTINIGTPEEAFRDLMASAALQVAPDDGSEN